MHLILSSLGCLINRRGPNPLLSRSRVPDRLAKMFRARCLPLVGKPNALRISLFTPGGLFVPKMSGAEGQSRADTGVAPTGSQVRRRAYQ